MAADPIERAVERSIVTMYENMTSSVTIDVMARAAMFSKFHFARVFHRTTGVSPGRFLSAIRLQQAKHLLVTTSLNVTEVSMRVGYNSVGTFSSRFTSNVGLCPSSFRRQGGFTPQIAPATPIETRHPVGGQVTGSVCTPTGRPGLIYLGLFPDRLPAGRPIRCTILDRPGHFSLDDVPDGQWHLLAHFVGTTRLVDAASRPFGDDDGLAVAAHGPITVRAGAVCVVDLPLRPITLLDPPVLMALLDQRKFALELVAGRHAA
ncbi:helix-turn-helix transcriptional regulator [Solwaraspora sp. WMMD406]|uniref:helix-turn-helix transcriptional regulator n=1 Tax=Solwaraspora sp. WMMD406 TaxID=3016095 RepID=UPI002415C1F7|nr:helix-turn-helix transcriptional regulator [Solwaraspora sp. WMMD406]MDG4766933.1 helix-turn-helix transcriptional regulator [Solwaraspora sp. WMMD406]